MTHRNQVKTSLMKDYRSYDAKAVYKHEANYFTLQLFIDYVGMQYTDTVLLYDRLFRGLFEQAGGYGGLLYSLRYSSYCFTVHQISSINIV